MGTPAFPDITDDQVRLVFSAAAAGAGPAQMVRPVTKAFGSQTFLVSTVSGNRYLLKIAREPAEFGRFQLVAENSARAIKAGVPAPRVLRIGQSDSIDGRAFMLQEYIEGQDGEDVYHSMSRAEKETFARGFGEAIGKLHTVEAPSFTEGVVAPEHAGDWSVHIAVRADKLAKYNRRAGVLELDELNEGCDRLKRMSKKLKDVIQPRLVHRDLTLRNALVDGGEFRALLDFEHARDSDPVFDFVRLGLVVWRSHPEIKDPFLKGYAESHPLKHPRFEERFHVALGLELLGGIPYFARNDLKEQLSVYTASYRAWLKERL